MEGYGVRLLFVLPGVRFLVQGVLFQFGQDARTSRPGMQTCKKIASHISVYLQTLDAATLPQEAYIPFRISLRKLRPMRSRRVKVKVKEDGYNVGSLCIALMDVFGARPVGRVAMVEQIYRKVDIAAVSASLDMCTFFSLGRTTAGRVTQDLAAWHAVRVHHRCRLLYPPDAPPDLSTAHST